MPLYALECMNGHQKEQFEHTQEDFGCRTAVCECGHTMAPTLSVGFGLTALRENKPQTIWNLGPEPVTVTGMRQYERLLKERGRGWATPARGRKGCWA